MAANVQAVANTFKSEILQALHNLGTTVTRAGTGADTIYAALYLTNQGIGAGTATYSATGEVTSGGGYTAGGVVVTNATAPTNASGTAYWTPSASIVYTTVTVGPTDCVLLYNSTQGNRAIGSYTFSAQTISAGTLTLTMPGNTYTTGLLRLT